jgi:hypothetical protein
MKAKIEMKRHKNKVSFLPPISIGHPLMHCSVASCTRQTLSVLPMRWRASPSISALAALAAAEDQAEAEELNNGETSSGLRLLKRQFIRTLHKVIDQSDLILLVLDARDPEGCRSKLVEDEVRRRESDGKKLIFILNKIGVYLSAIWSRTITHLNRRLDTSRKCGGVAQASQTYCSNPSFQIVDTRATIEYNQPNIPLPPQPHKILQTPLGLHHSRCSRLSKCREVIPYQLPQACKGLWSSRRAWLDQRAAVRGTRARFTDNR